MEKRSEPQTGQTYFTYFYSPTRITKHQQSTKHGNKHIKPHLYIN